MHERSSAVVVSLFCALVLAGVLVAGPLDPPPGPVAETDTALRETDPRIPIGPDTTPGDANSVFQISEPGSYFLTGDMTSAVGNFAVEIIASDVTLDLNGYAIVGVPGSFDGVLVGASGVSGVEVKNGVIRDHGFRGINFAASNAAGCTLRDLRVKNNGQDGVLPGTNALIERCVVTNNASDGIQAGAGSLIRDCIASGNGRDGIQTGEDSRVVGCVARANALTGINAGESTTVEENVASDNGEHGISIARACRAIGNTCEGNADHGIDVRSSARFVRVEGNHRIGNDFGIRSNATDGLYLRNTCADSATNNWAVGSGNSLLVVKLSTMGGSVAGDSGGATPGGSDNPHVNWSY